MDTSAALPMELRAALDLMCELLAGEGGVLRTSLYGNPTLVSALATYGLIETQRDHSTMLGAAVNEINLTIARDEPRRVVVLGAGRLQRTLRPFRSGVMLIPRLPGNHWWAHRGYQLVRTIKVQGIGSIFWSGIDRLLRRFNRPQVADRCRIAMLRTLVAARSRLIPATLLIQEYRRVT
jgi:hypothetical protein